MVSVILTTRAPRSDRPGEESRSPAIPHMEGSRRREETERKPANGWPSSLQHTFVDSRYALRDAREVEVPSLDRLGSVTPARGLQHTSQLRAEGLGISWADRRRLDAGEQL